MLPEYVPGFLSETEPLQLPGTCGLKPFSRGLRRSSKKRSAASSQTGNLQWLQWFLGCVGWSLSGLRAAAWCWMFFAIRILKTTRFEAPTLQQRLWQGEKTSSFRFLNTFAKVRIGVDVSDTSESQYTTIILDFAGSESCIILKGAIPEWQGQNYCSWSASNPPPFSQLDSSYTAWKAGPTLHLKRFFWTNWAGLPVY